MVCEFRCKVAGDVVMTRPAGDALLRVIGIEPGGDPMMKRANAEGEAIVWGV